VEAVQVSYDAAATSYETLLGVWFSCLDDPYDARGQGADRGAQYRPGVFWHSAAQRDAAAAFLAEREQSARRSGGGGTLVARLLKPAARFHAAEACHQQYLARGASPALHASCIPLFLPVLTHSCTHARVFRAGGLDPDPETPYWMGCYLD
jgi:peptide methionine sulfoxide reductase MsrA